MEPERKKSFCLRILSFGGVDEVMRNDLMEAFGGMELSMRNKTYE